MPHDGEGGFEARGQCLVHVSLYIGQKVIVDVDVVLGRYAAACGIEHTLMPIAWLSANYSHAAGGGTRVGPAELLEEPIMFGKEVGEEEICRCKCCDGLVPRSLPKLRCRTPRRWPRKKLAPQ